MFCENRKLVAAAGPNCNENRMLSTMPWSLDTTDAALLQQLDDGNQGFKEEVPCTAVTSLRVDVAGLIAAFSISENSSRATRSVVKQRILSYDRVRAILGTSIVFQLY